MACWRVSVSGIPAVSGSKTVERPENKDETPIISRGMSSPYSSRLVICHTMSTFSQKGKLPRWCDDWLLVVDWILVPCMVCNPWCVFTGLNINFENTSRYLQPYIIIDLLLKVVTPKRGNRSSFDRLPFVRGSNRRTSVQYSNRGSTVLDPVSCSVRAMLRSKASSAHV